MTDAPAARAVGVLPADLDARLRGELGMPFLPTLFTLLGRHPDYLKAAAEAFLELRLDGIEEHAGASRRIGSDAARSLVDQRVHAGADARAVGELIDLYNRVNPPFLLFTLFLWSGSGGGWRVMESPLPPHQRGDLLADIRACHGGFGVPGFWRELDAGWPDPARAAWALLRRLPERAAFARARDAVRSLAGAKVACARAPVPPVAHAGEIERTLAFYAIVIPTMVVEIECLRRAVA